jgi:hypothetical protein
MTGDYLVAFFADGDNLSASLMYWALKINELENR